MQYKWTLGALLTAISLGGALNGINFENPFSSKQVESSQQMIKVLVAHESPGVVLEVKGKYKIFDPNKNAFISTRFVGKRNFVQTLSDGLKWGEEFPGVYQIAIVPENEKTTTLVDGVEYSGKISVYDIGGAISVVNEVPLEDYVKAVASYNYDRKLPQELSNAVAIAIRSEAWYQHKNAKQRFWDVQADNVGYQGSAVAQDNRFAKAVQSTRNMILTQGGKPLSLDWASAKNSPAETSEISFAEAEQFAGNGDQAVQILQKAYPQGRLFLIK
jgi:stage II sporulation protein D